MGNKGAGRETKTPVPVLVPVPVAVKKKGGGVVATLVRTVAPLIPVALAGASLFVPAKHTPAPQPAPPKRTQPAPAVGVVPPISAPTLMGLHCGGAGMPVCTVPYPLLAKGHPVDWFFVFKLNAGAFPMCGGGTRACPFGGTVQAYPKGWSQQFAYASSETNTLEDGGQECLGTSTGDPVGATFDEVYNGSFHYVIWNDQPYGDPKLECNGDSCSAPWGHSKGMVAWNDEGVGFVMQVSTPSWPLSGSVKNPRKGGNTLGCVTDDDVLVSQHFFALRLSKSDLLVVLQGLYDASVVTDPGVPQVAHVGGPADVVALAKKLGTKPTTSPAATPQLLSTNVVFLVKPSAMHVPPWQMVSARLGGVDLRTANWWVQKDPLPSTTAATPMGCWDPVLGRWGAVEIATSGMWKGVRIGLAGGSNPNGNHAKIGVTTSGGVHYAIFGDENQEGDITGKACQLSQNARGGTFYVMNNAALAASLTTLIAGDSAPLTVPPRSAGGGAGGDEP